MTSDNSVNCNSKGNYALLGGIGFGAIGVTGGAIKGYHSTPFVDKNGEATDEFIKNVADDVSRADNIYNCECNLFTKPAKNGKEVIERSYKAGQKLFNGGNKELTSIIKEAIKNSSNKEELINLIPEAIVELNKQQIDGIKKAAQNGHDVSSLWKFLTGEDIKPEEMDKMLKEYEQGVKEFAQDVKDGLKERFEGKSFKECKKMMLDDINEGSKELSKIIQNTTLGGSEEFKFEPKSTKTETEPEPKTEKPTDTEAKDKKVPEGNEKLPNEKKPESELPKDVKPENEKNEKLIEKLKKEFKEKYWNKDEKKFIEDAKDSEEKILNAFKENAKKMKKAAAIKWGAIVGGSAAVAGAIIGYFIKKD